jgi:hypothetical protein
VLLDQRRSIRWQLVGVVITGHPINNNVLRVHRARLPLHSLDTAAILKLDQGQL